MLFNFGQLSWALRRRLGRFEGKALASTLVRTALPSAAMALAVRGLVAVTETSWRGSFTGAAAVVGGGMVVGLGITWALYRVARVAELPELEAAVGGLLRRLGLSRGPAGGRDGGAPGAP